MNATTYDDADVIPGAQPSLMCVACEKQEVGKAAGIVGPLDLHGKRALLQD